MNVLPNKQHPCNNCPFRKDTKKGWLGFSRMKEITESNSFVCHKTTGSTKSKRMQCAGHLILMREENSFFALAKSLGINLKLKGQNLIFNSKKHCINHHKN